MARYVKGSEALTRRLQAMPKAVLEALNPALARSAQEIAADASAYQLPFGVHDLLSPLKTRVTGYQPEPEAV